MYFLGLPARHLPPLLLGTATTVACFPCYFNVPWAIGHYGLPDRIASSSTAHSPWMLYTNRAHVVGMLILTFLAKRNYAAVDTVMAFIGFMGAMDVYVCLKEDVPRTATWRGIASGLMAAWGLLGMTQVSHKI
ncbi:hypothetical protein BKA63DRAFT_424808 [Paraphoma chrysanthemicola]|nr:hypothetical protein BKA63DRAFT_424808 [Paraphoma chrysanthemicola]